MYQLVLFDKGYTFEHRWVFSRTLTISEMVKVVGLTFQTDRYTNTELYGDVRLQEYSGTLSSLVYIDFCELELDDYILEVSVDK